VILAKSDTANLMVEKRLLRQVRFPPAVCGAITDFRLAIAGLYAAISWRLTARPDGNFMFRRACLGNKSAEILTLLQRYL
jgi:hypothetical protein